MILKGPKIVKSGFRALFRANGFSPAPGGRQEWDIVSVLSRGWGERRKARIGKAAPCRSLEAESNRELLVFPVTVSYN